MGPSIIQNTKIVVLPAHREKKNLVFIFSQVKFIRQKAKIWLLFYTKVGCIFSSIFGSFLLFLLKSLHLIHSFDLCFLCRLNKKKQKNQLYHPFIQFLQNTTLINFFREIKKGENTLPLCIQIVLLCFNICFVHAFVGL